jgi:transcriptional regulator with XRE-family HTH domain
MIMNDFDANLKRLRIQRNMKQEDLAKKMDVTRQTVSGWETGRRQPDLNTLKKIADVLDVDIHELIYGSKREEYPKFQIKYVNLTILFGGTVLLLHIMRLLFWPWIKVLCHNHHWGLPLFIGYYLMPLIGSFLFGGFFPSLLQLFIPLRFRKKLSVMCWISCVAMLLPAPLFWTGFLPLSGFLPFSLKFSIVTYILPFLSGVCAVLGCTTGNEGLLR